MTHEHVHRFISGAVSLLILAPAFIGCQTNSDRYTLEAIEKSIGAVIRKAEDGVVVIDLVTPSQETSPSDTGNSEHRYGSGFVYRTDGYIVTTDGLLGSAEDSWVLTQKGDRLPATVVGRDFETNIAVLKVEGDGLQALPLADSIAMNGCLGIMTANTYYSEGLSCSWGMVNQTWMGGGDFLDHKLLTIHIHWPEVHSGTPVLDSQGRLIGITEGHLENTRCTWTIIASKTITEVAERLIAEGSITRGWLGLRSNPVCPVKKTSRLMKQWKGKGAVVSSIVPNSPADRAGIQVGDAILRCDGTPILCISDLRRMITVRSPGTNVVLDINRDGEEITLEITLSTLIVDPERQRRSVRRST